MKYTYNNFEQCLRQDNKYFHRNQIIYLVEQKKKKVKSKKLTGLGNGSWNNEQNIYCILFRQKHLWSKIWIVPKLCRKLQTANQSTFSPFFWSFVTDEWAPNENPIKLKVEQ